MDETTDLTGRSIANVIIGILDFESKMFLLNTQEFEKVNYNTIAMLFNDSMSILYPN